MARRDQPYLPLYIQDFLTDEKLVECSAAATGVYIRLMCIMHKSENYGKILLKQKHKQTSEQIKNFALMIAKQMPYDVNTILKSLNELIDEKVLHIEDDFLVQQRMVKDGELSDTRASSGGKGGKKTQQKTKQFATNFAKAKSEANSEIEIATEFEGDLKLNHLVKKEKKTRKKFTPPTIEEVREFAETEMIGSKILPEKFYNYYESNGWKVGRNPMKNWRTKFKSWSIDEKDGTYQQPISRQSTGETKTERDARAWEEFGKDYLEGRRTISTLFGFDENRTDAG